MAALPGAGWEEGAGRARPQGLGPAGGARSPGGRGPGAPRLTQSCPPQSSGVSARSARSSFSPRGRPRGSGRVRPPEGRGAVSRAPSRQPRRRETAENSQRGGGGPRGSASPSSPSSRRSEAGPARCDRPPGAGGPGPGPGRRLRGAGDRAGAASERLRRPFARGPGARPAPPLSPPAALGPERRDLGGCPASWSRARRGEGCWGRCPKRLLVGFALFPF